MATILLVVIYLVFIGLGLPDSVFGTAWPAIYPEFNVPVSYANFVTVIISCGTVISSLASARVIHRFGTAVVTMVSTAMTAVALLGFSLSGSMGWLCLFALPLGLGAGAIAEQLHRPALQGGAYEFYCLLLWDRDHRKSVFDVLDSGRTK